MHNLESPRANLSNPNIEATFTKRQTFSEFGDSEQCNVVDSDDGNITEEDPQITDKNKIGNRNIRPNKRPDINNKGRKIGNGMRDRG